MEEITVDSRSANHNTHHRIQNAYTENSNGIISRQPNAVSSVAVINTTNVDEYATRNGLQILDGISKLTIQQTTGVADLTEYVSSENRYTVKASRDDTIAYATESSDDWQRICFGSGRSFSMRLYDRNQREVLFFKRRLACGSCTFWCFLQRLEVWMAPGELLGTVSQQMSFCLKTSFKIYDRNGRMVFLIEGPSSFGCLLSKSQHFEIYHIGNTKIGSIVYQWDQLQVSNYLELQIPENIQNNEHKALLLGCAFLLEYMFFENLKTKSCNKCFC